MANKNKSVALQAPIEIQDLEKRQIAGMIKDGTEVSVFLVSGTKLVGVITKHSAKTLTLDGDREQIVWFHGIATICPQQSGTRFAEE